MPGPQPGVPPGLVNPAALGWLDSPPAGATPGAQPVRVPLVPYLVAEGALPSGSTSNLFYAQVPVQQGDLIAVWVTTNATSNNINGVSDPENGAYTAGGTPASNGALNGQWFIMPAAQMVSQGMAFTFTTANTAGSKTFIAVAIPGVRGVSPADVKLSATGSTTPGSASTGTLAQAREVVLAGFTVGGGGPASPVWSSPFTPMADNQRNAAAQWAAAAYDVVNSTASVTATAATSNNIWIMALLSLEAQGLPDTAAIVDSLVAGHAEPDVAAIVDSLVVTHPHSDVAAIVDSLLVKHPHPDTAAIVDSLMVSGNIHNLPDKIAVIDTLTVSAGKTVQFQPAAPGSTVAGEYALEYIPGVSPLAPASPAFLRSAMPRLYMQNLLTGAWLHRDVQGITSPMVNWQLNAAGTFACTLSPPRPDMMDATGNPLPVLWQTACYLEELDEIKWGGILTAMAPQGPQLALTFTEFTGYANGMPYEGPDIQYPGTGGFPGIGEPSRDNGIDGLDAVRGLWAWLQAQPNGNIALELDKTMSGTILGQTSPFSASSVLTSDAHAGDTRVNILPPPPAPPGQTRTSVFTLPGHVQVGTDNPRKITYAGIDHLLLGQPVGSFQPKGSLVGEIQPTTPFTLNWYNGTDIGQEITSIQAEAVFDSREVHVWANPGKTAVRHHLIFGVPRIGARRSDLRFAEGENITVAAQGSQDGSTFANDVVGIGAGTGSGSVRSGAAVVDGRLRRTQLFTDQTITRPDRLAARVRRVLASRNSPDAITSIVVRNHPNAPLGSYIVGDDIPVRLASGWRNALIWSRIIGMQQDPQTNLVTLALARSDSFTYEQVSGVAGTL